MYFKDYFRRAGKIGWLLVAMCIGGLLLAYWWQNDRVIAVESMVLTTQKYLPALVLTGEVIADQTVQVLSRTSGQITEVQVEEGQPVEAGSVLISLHNQDLLLAVEKARAAREAKAAKLNQALTIDRIRAEVQLQQAQIAYKKAEADWQRNQALFEAGMISDSEKEIWQDGRDKAAALLRTAEAETAALGDNGATIQSLRADLAQSEAEEASAVLQLQYTRIPAPINAMVLNLPVHLGEWVEIGQPVAALGVFKGTRVRVRPDQRFNHLAVLGNPALVWVSNQPERNWKGAIVKVDSIGDAGEGTKGVEILLGEDAAFMAPGTLVSVQLLAGRESDGLILPDAWMTTLDNQVGVWMERNGRAYFQPVTLGERTGQGALVNTGLNAGDRIVKPDNVELGKRIRVATDE